MNAKLIALLVLLVMAAPSWAGDERIAELVGPAKSFLVVGYLPSYQLKSFDPDRAKYVDCLIYFSVEPTAGGELDRTTVGPDALDRLKAIKRRFGTPIEIAVTGGKGNGGLGPGPLPIARFVRDPQKRRQFVEALLKLCLDDRFDGVDFDWEFPRGKAELAAFAALLVESKAALGPHKLLVTAAVSSGQELPLDAVCAVDRLHLMSYESLAQARDDVKRVLARGVPREKLILGAPFYGTDPDGKPRYLSYAQIVRRFHPKADAESAAGYSFNGIAAMKNRTEFAQEQGLGGLMIWELGQDTTDDTSLLGTVHAALPAK